MGPKNNEGLCQFVTKAIHIYIHQYAGQFLQPKLDYYYDKTASVWNT